MFTQVPSTELFSRCCSREEAECFSFSSSQDSLATMGDAEEPMASVAVLLSADVTSESEVGGVQTQERAGLV